VGESKVAGGVVGDVTVHMMEGWCPRMNPSCPVHWLVAELAYPAVASGYLV
jgi:hypothetical protein